MNTSIRADVETRRFKLSELEFADYNPREMSDEARAGLAQAIARFGLLDMPVVNIKDGKKRVVGGHQRVRDLIASHFTHADCVVVRFDETAEMAANIALNSPTIQGTYDLTKVNPGLDQLRASLPVPDFARFETVAKALHEQASRLKAATKPTAKDDGAASDAAPNSVAGRVYGLGDHRLYCGDFEAGIARLLPQHYAHAVITDPPYNIGYTSGKRFRNDALREPIEGDAQDAEEWDAFVTRLARVLLASCDGPIYTFFAAKELPLLDAAWTRNKGEVHRWLLVAKSAHPLSPGDYHPQYELCMFGSRRNAKFELHGDAVTNVIPSERPARNAYHPTQKPVELIRTLMEHATDVEEVVLDPFAGSGTTLVVAQDLARICYACEIDPVHCDTIRKRWAEQVHGDGCDWVTLTKPTRK